MRIFLLVLVFGLIGGQVHAELKKVMVGEWEVFYSGFGYRCRASLYAQGSSFGYDNNLWLRVDGPTRYFDILEEGVPYFTADNSNSIYFRIDDGPVHVLRPDDVTSVNDFPIFEPDIFGQLLRGSKLEVTQKIEGGARDKVQTFDLTGMTEVMRWLEHPDCMAVQTAEWARDKLITRFGEWSVLKIRQSCYIENVIGPNKLMLSRGSRRLFEDAHILNLEVNRDWRYLKFRIDDGPSFSPVFYINFETLEPGFSEHTLESMKLGRTLQMRYGGKADESEGLAEFSLDGFDKALDFLLGPDCDKN